MAQRIALDCKTKIERAYYNPKSGRGGFQTGDVCIHCGMSSCLVADHALQDGRACFPICSICLEAKKPAVARSGAKKRPRTVVDENNKRNAKLREERQGKQ
uniref:Uncharacterized protein n=1 Tax=Grammatophora oceanica TaxID=210454 RepID=A0A7S1UM92_9STRA|mmetsp:Transcript_1239/g.1752  ORF Transcript_1239/g.1752 Transcript_1239/m.1752 type:complete len:101 (+) Transcript_1239:264-566(+)